MVVGQWLQINLAQYSTNRQDVLFDLAQCAIIQ